MAANAQNMKVNSFLLEFQLWKSGDAVNFVL